MNARLQPRPNGQTDHAQELASFRPVVRRKGALRAMLWHCQRGHDHPWNDTVLAGEPCPFCRAARPTSSSQPTANFDAAE